MHWHLLHWSGSGPGNMSYTDPPPRYSTVVLSLDDNTEIAESDTSAHVTQLQPIASRFTTVLSYTGTADNIPTLNNQLIVSCLVMWFCNFPYGLVAFILAGIQRNRFFGLLVFVACLRYN